MQFQNWVVPAFHFEIGSFVIESPQILRAGKNACLETQLVLMYRVCVKIGYPNNSMVHNYQQSTEIAGPLSLKL
jgi:hypothetical protein